MKYSNKINTNTPLIKIDDSVLSDTGLILYIKREDLNHPQLSGNKLYKLKYNLEEAKNKNFDALLTFGGAFSNHIYAVAAAGKIFDFKTIGIIRGEEHQPLNSTLLFAKESGMEINYLERKSYRNKRSGEVINSLRQRFGRFYLIPEGGTNELAVKGCSEIPFKINIEYDYLCCACGTGGTLAGLIAGANRGKKILGFSVLKGGGFLKDDIHSLLEKYTNNTYNNWDINLDYHFGGYAKINKELVQFIDEFKKTQNIPLEPIYTGKMLYGIFDLAKKGFFKRGTIIIAIHTGGLQGLSGLSERIKKLQQID